MSEGHLQAGFIASRKGRIFVLVRHPAGRAQRCIVIVPALAEEMNKSRRMMTLAAQALVRSGYAVALPDLFGTGDSEGEFSDADWETWQDDLRTTVKWCAENVARVTGVLGVRMGCALISALRGSGQSIERTVFWQPMFDGGRWLDQFLRLRVAASMMEEDRKETVSGLRGQLSAGEIVDVAGYPVAPSLAAQLTAVRSADAAACAFGKVTWLEVTRSAEGGLPGAAAAVRDRLVNAGVAVETEIIPGQPFWSSTEIVEVPELVVATARAFAEAA